MAGEPELKKKMTCILSCHHKPSEYSAVIFGKYPLSLDVYQVDRKESSHIGIQTVTSDSQAGGLLIQIAVVFRWKSRSLLNK